MALDVVLLVDIAQSGKIYASRGASRLQANPRVARRRRRGVPFSRKDKAKTFLDHRRQGAIIGRRSLARATQEILWKADGGSFSHTSDITSICLYVKNRHGKRPAEAGRFKLLSSFRSPRRAPVRCRVR